MSQAGGRVVKVDAIDDAGDFLEVRDAMVALGLARRRETLRTLTIKVFQIFRPQK